MGGHRHVASYGATTHVTWLGRAVKGFCEPGHTGVRCGQLPGVMIGPSHRVEHTELLQGGTTPSATHSCPTARLTREEIPVVRNTAYKGHEDQSIAPLCHV